jgi:hypothetical protein
MPFPTTLTINLGTEAQAEVLAKAMCAEARVPFSAAAARQVAVDVLHAYVAGHLERSMPPPVVEGLS